MPLFLLTDPRHVQANDQRLFLYKNSVSHCYFVNGTQELEHEVGYKQFCQPQGFAHYIERAKDMMQKMAVAEQEFCKINLKLLSDHQLHGLHDKLLNLFFEFSSLYTQTEAVRTKKFEQIKNPKTKSSLQKIGRMRFELRKSVESFLPLLLHFMLKEIVRRYGIKPLDWFFYDHREVGSGFKGRKVASKTIEQRKKGYALLNVNCKNRLFVGPDSKQAWKLVRRLSQDQRKELKGLCVQKGKVKGRVELLIHNVRDLSSKVRKFKAGNILVTEMTTPNTILACKKAAAIITDEGGVLCHAAIVSRELKIPCIVGTKHATQILKDGDEVEVDAEQGIVRIIARNK